MSSGYNYDPKPPRAWSRVQNSCTYFEEGNPYDQIYMPLTGQSVSQAQANYEEKLYYKGNILQYKGNSSSLTKKQRYSQLAKGFGPNRTKVFATQTQTYTNPNTNGLLRINYSTFPFPNQLVGKPNNISGPFQYDVQSPFDCSNNSVQDGGNLVCGTYANPCTGEIIQTNPSSATICNPSYCSDVPGRPIELCWNNKLQTFFPRQRYFMNNSGNKWPQGYKGFVSAVRPGPPYLMLDSYTSTTATLSWTNPNEKCAQITSYNIYKNNILIESVPYTSNMQPITISGLTDINNFYVTSLIINIDENSTIIESNPSNFVTSYNIPFTTTGSPIINYTNNYYTLTFNSTGSITFDYNFYVDMLAIGGGGGGGGSNAQNNYRGGGGGGGGGGIGVLLNAYIEPGTYSIIVGTGGSGGKKGIYEYNDYGQGVLPGASGGETKISKNNDTSNYLTATGGTGGKTYYQNSLGGISGTSTSSYTNNGFYNYNTANGGNGYKNMNSVYSNGTANISSTSIKPDILKNIAFNSGGDGGGQFNNSNGNNGNTFGSGGGGGAYSLDNVKSYTGGKGGDGIVIIKFKYP